MVTVVLRKSWRAMMDQEQDTSPWSNYFVCRVVSYQSCIGCELIHIIGTFSMASTEFSVTRGCLLIYTPDTYIYDLKVTQWLSWYTQCFAMDHGHFYWPFLCKEVVMSHLAALWSPCTLYMAMKGEFETKFLGFNSFDAQTIALALFHWAKVEEWSPHGTQ